MKDHKAGGCGGQFCCKTCGDFYNINDGLPECMEHFDLCSCFVKPAQDPKDNRPFLCLPFP